MQAPNVIDLDHKNAEVTYIQLHLHLGVDIARKVVCVSAKAIATLTTSPGYCGGSVRQSDYPECPSMQVNELNVALLSKQ